MENVSEFLAQYGGLILAGVVLAVVWLVNRNLSAFKNLLGAIFLDVQKRVTEAAISSGPEAMGAALQDLFNALDTRFKFFKAILSVAAFVLGTSVQDLAANIAQRVYDELRRTAGAAKTAK